jgi:GDP-mannose 6-dehydrogenase
VTSLKNEQLQPLNVAVLGLGYVGCVTAACLAKLGHFVTGVDSDEFKVRNVMAGNAPFYEPGLEEFVRETVASGRLKATSSLAEGLADADVALICVGTPSEANGNIGLTQLRRVSEQIAANLEGRSKRLIVVIRSTVFPGTCEEVVMGALNGKPNFSMVSNPEFLREGVAMRDFMEPSLLVVGGDDPAAVRAIADLYAGLDVVPCLVTLRTAEMIKYACNCFHAVKIGFANEIGTLCGQLGIPAGEVMSTLCQDVKLNVSAAYLKPGFAFGGSCLPKDLRALTYRASRMDLKLPLLESVMPSNERHLERALRAALMLPADAKIGVFGLAFKENTDDLRESPVVTLIEHLLGKGRDLRVYDPHIVIDQIYGSNKNYVLNAVPHIGKLMAASLDEVLSSCGSLIITQRIPAETAEKIKQSGIRVLNVAAA